MTKLSTLNQLYSKKIKFFKKVLNPLLKIKPQVRAVVLRCRIMTPRKPNSARRPIVKFTTKRRAKTKKGTNKYRRLSFMKRLAHIPGSGHNLRKHSEILVSGVGARDLPGVRFSCIRGVYDFSPLVGKKRRRSVYGLKRPIKLRDKLRRKFRLKN